MTFLSFFSKTKEWFCQKKTHFRYPNCSTLKIIFYAVFAVGHSLGAAILGATIANPATPFDRVILDSAFPSIQDPKSIQVEVAWFRGENNKRMHKNELPIKKK